jgi:chitinase
MRTAVRLFAPVRLCALGVLFSAIAVSTCFASEATGRDVIAYLFVKDRTIAPDEVAASKLTRVNYAFADIKDGKIVQGFLHDRDNFKILHSLKRQNPHLQIVVSVGGWTWSGAFSDMSLTPQSRKTFIESAVQFIRDNELDGLDIDWEYPGSIGNGNTFRAEDKQNYTALLRELRSRLDIEGKKLGRHLVTSIAVGASTEFIDHTEMNEVQRYVDSVNLMSYDYYEAGSDLITGHHAPLYTNPTDPKHISADESVQEFMKAGVPADKLVLGVPFYGRAWGEVSDTNHGLFQPGKMTKLDANYNSIAETLLNNGFVRYWDSSASAPYLYNSANHIFVSYDDPESMTLKCHYVLKHKLAGVMFWDYSGDSNHALLDSINQGLGRMPKIQAK